MRSLPKTVTRQRRDCDLNPGPSSPESSTLTTRLPSTYLYVTVQVILSHATHLYLDMKHEPDPEEPGLYWASRETPLKKVFSYRPDSIYDNVDVDLDGRTLDRRTLCTEFACPPLTAPDNIIGTIVHHTTFQSVMCRMSMRSIPIHLGEWRYGPWWRRWAGFKGCKMC